MNKKRGVLIIGLILFLLISSSSVLAELGCCISQANGCQSLIEKDVCISDNPNDILREFHEGESCEQAVLESQSTLCDVGCCCDGDPYIRTRIQCQSTLKDQITTEDACIAECDLTEPPVSEPPADEGETEPETPAEVPEEEEEEPEEPSVPFYESYCGNNEIDFYEICDGTIDTKAEGAFSDCENQCGTPDSAYPCKCPVSCSQNPVAAILQSAQALTGEKKISLAWAFPATNCKPTNVFVERCEGQNPSLCIWTPIIGDIAVNNFVDSNFDYDKYYSYRIGAFYYDSSNYAVTKYSNIITVSPLDEFCVKLNSADISDKFCDANWEARCNQQNQIERIFSCDLQPNSVCVAGTCQARGPCSECAVPFGLFLLPQCQYPACYLDYSKFNVDTYQECGTVGSCYDYNSETACEDNQCNVPACEWSDSDLSELGIGVCRPAAKEYQDCDQCSSSSNTLIGGCDADSCSLVGDDCRFTSKDTCIDDNGMACIYYTSQEACTGVNDIVLELDEKNSIVQKSQDQLGIGTCRWTDRCIKDANVDILKDCTENDYECQADNIPPETIVPKIPVASLNVEIPFSVFDNVYSAGDTKTYYAIAEEWTYPTIEAQGNTFSKIIGTSGFYFLTYYSVDKSNNLEEVKSLKFYVDGEKPQVEVNYNAIPQELSEDNWVSKVDITVKAEDNADTLVTCTGKLLQGNVEFEALDKLENELIAEKTIHYSDIPDGFHVFHYECQDRSGNVDAGNVLVSVSGDRSLVEPLPITTLNNHQSIQISIKSTKSAECKYSSDINSFDHMTESFTTVNNLLHTATVDVLPQISHHRYYVKCKLTETDVIVGGVNDEIRFTIDEKPPVTKVQGKQQTCAADWLHNDFELIFDCQDPAQRKQGYPNEFSCSKTYYCTGTGCNPAIEFSNSMTLSQTTPIKYYSVDLGGNAETIKSDIIQIDKEKPSISISLIDSVNNIPVTDRTIRRTTQEPYVIDIISSKTIEKFDEFGFVLSNNDQYILPKPYPKSLDKKVWQTLLNPSELTNLVTQAVFQINAVAEHSWRIDKLEGGIDTFYINTAQDMEDVPTGTASGSITLSEVKVGEEIILPQTVDGKTLYTLQDKDIQIKGSVSGLDNLWYYVGTDRIEVPLVDNQFEISTELISVEDAALETVLYFVGVDSEARQLSKSFVFLIDKQGPLPIDYELQNAAGDMIKTPLPSIVVEFDEPVELVEYGIKNFDIEIEAQELNNQVFQFDIKEPLSNGCYKLFVKAKDFLGNVPLSDYEIGFGIDASDTKIILETPHHGVSQVKDFDMKVKTTWAATCKYAYTEPDSFDHPLLLNFDTTGVLEHTKKAFSITTEQPFYIICDDGRNVIKESFILKLDSQAPSIVRAVADPPIVSQQGVNSKLVVETDEDYTICKYSKVSSDFTQMRFFPGESLDVAESYKKIHYKPLPFDGEQRSETYYVQCEDLSGRRSDVKSISFKVEEQALAISVQNPPKYTAERFIDLNFTTNEVANCKYKNVSAQWQTISSETREHSYPLGRFAAGTHTIDLECVTITGLVGALSKPEIAELAYTFTIDLTKPTMKSVSGGNYSCPVDENYLVGISFNAFDNESMISMYNFDVVDDKGEIILANQTSSTAQTNIETKLTQGSKYKIIASSVNGAGLESSTKQSSPILAKDILDAECKERKAPAIEFRVLQSAGGVNVVMVCDDESGCDADSLKYGMSTEPECAPVNPYSQEIELSESMFFCGRACDSVGNCGTKQEKIDVLVGDSDNDGIIDTVDECAGTPIGETVDELGCSEAQRYIDTDGDNVRDQLDLCPNTPSGQTVDMQGCPSMIAYESEAPEIVEEETSIFSLVLMVLGSLLLLGGIGYFAYIKYFIPKPSTKSLIPPRFIRPIKRIFIPRRKLKLSARRGKDLFRSLETTTKGRLFERLSNFVRKEEHDLFGQLERVTRFRKTRSPRHRDVFDQLTKLTSFRRTARPKHPIKELGKVVRKKKKKKK